MPNKFEIQSSDIADISKTFGEIERSIQKKHKKFVKEIPKKLLAFLKKETPRDTGQTADSWRMAKNNKGFVLSNQRGAIIEFLIEGTSSHLIQPKNGSVLLLDLPGSRVFAKFVNHPGYPPQMDINSIKRQMSKIIEKEFKKIFDS